MLVNQLVKFCFSASKICLAILLLSTTLTTGIAQAGEVSSTVPIVKKANRTVATNGRMLSNGTYLYGETNLPGKVGSEYVVFENQGGQAVGAVFLNGSEYSCFSGQVHGDQLQMMVLDGYENAERPYAISLEGESGAANGGDGTEYRSVNQIGKQEMGILDTCRSFYRERFSRLSVRG
jgi:hypothetical protein